MKGIIGNWAGKIDNGIATLRTQNGKVVSSSKGKREVLVEHYSKIGTPKPHAKFDAEFEKEINAWAEVNVDASKREDSGSIELQREFTRDEVKKCVAKLKNRKADGGRRNTERVSKVWGRGDDHYDGSVVQLDLEKRVHTQEMERRSSSQPFQKRRQDRPREL